MEPTAGEARDVIQQLRRGVPPRAQFVELISSGGDEFFEKVRRRCLEPENVSGDIRFVVGSWGSGKTHFFRRLKHAAFDEGYLVSNVELSAQETPFNRFERVVYSIVNEIASPHDDDSQAVAPIGRVLRRALGTEESMPLERQERYRELRERLDADDTIDPDVKRVVRAYWETFVTDNDVAEQSIDLNERRDFLMQWFGGDVDKRRMRSEFGVQKQVTKENARQVLGSLVALARLLGYRGLVVLFDESEMSTSTMSKSNRKDAHNNLLHLINEVDRTPGLLLVYAAVPEFWIDERYGITTYGALSQRIGSLPEYPPRALDTTWNIEMLSSDPTVYVDTAKKIRELYLIAYPGESEALIASDELERRIGLLLDEHGQYTSVSRWRLVVKETVKLIDLGLDGEGLPDPFASYRESLGILQRADEE